MKFSHVESYQDGDDTIIMAMLKNELLLKGRFPCYRPNMVP